MAPARVTWQPETIRIENVQALVLRGLSAMKASSYLAFRIDPQHVREARAWLREIAEEVSSAVDPVVPRDQLVNVAFTYTGLQHLGMPESALAGFRSAFADGIATPSHRSEALGDVGCSAPGNWDWGNRKRSIDGALLLFTRRVDQIGPFAAHHCDRLGKHGLSLIGDYRTGELAGRKEHFGFRDGISQPALRNGNPEGRRPGVLETDAPANTVEPGEFLFGYTNAYGAVARGPEVDDALDVGDALTSCPLSPGKRDFACDGSFMVWRQLEEHVQKFWRAIHERCRDDAEERKRLAAKLFGRWPSGAPLALAPEVDDPALEDANDFGYVVDDAHGYLTPLGAHIRRGNPRDWSLSRDPSRSRGISNAHRIIRRGRPYGPPLVDSMDPEEILRATDDGAARGVQFVCFMADIDRQFELIQGTWLNDEKFAGLYDEADPVLGSGPEREALFTVQASPIGHRFGGLSRFVTVRGGAYLFMPGIPALRFLGALRTDPTDAASLEPLEEPT